MNEDLIRQHLLNIPEHAQFVFHIVDRIDSTNKFLKEQPCSDNITICCAEEQTHGRGRFGRTWHSPFGENIYCSLRWNFNCALSKLSSLSMIVSLALIQALKDLTSNIKIKWPNDLIWEDKKLAGCLIEMLTTSNNKCTVVIGIGINVNTSHEKDNSRCSLKDIVGHELDRNRLLGSIITHVYYYLEYLQAYNSNDLLKQWHQFDYLYGKMITVYQADLVLYGKAVGINNNGLLQVEDTQGVIRYFASGETSLKQTENL